MSQQSGSMGEVDSEAVVLEVSVVVRVEREVVDNELVSVLEEAVLLSVLVEVHCACGRSFAKHHCTSMVACQMQLSTMMSVVIPTGITAPSSEPSSITGETIKRYWCM